MKTFVQELKTRRVYRVALAYVVAGSAAVQLAGTVLPVFHAPEWSQQVFVVLIAVSFPMAVMLAWSFDVKDGTIRKARRSRGRSVVANRRRLVILGVASSFVALCALATYSWWHPWSRVRREEDPATPDLLQKSIAVLPFENLTDQKQTGYFVEGIQDEILTRLSKVIDLKVISRTSVMPYKTGLRNVRAIARELGVANLVEGTIQRDGDRVRLNVQLIDARTDTHLWAEEFDRTIADIFAIQTEIAEQVVAQLRAKLSPAEKVALTAPATHDLTAYEFYVHGRNLIDAIAFSGSNKPELLEAARLFEAAVKRDPKFLAGWCELAHVHDLLYFLGIDHSAARLKTAAAAVEQASALQPDAGETRLAIARHLYWGTRDYTRARQELELAKRALPNDPSVLLLAGFIDRRQARWSDSTAELEHALEVDPKNTEILGQISFNYESLHRYADELRVVDRILAISPKDVTARVRRAAIALDSHGDPKPLHAAIEAALAAQPDAAATLREQAILLALCEKDADAAARDLVAMPEEGIFSNGFHTPKAYYVASVARAFHKTEEAAAAFAVARGVVEQMLQHDSNYPQALSLLALCDAALGRKQAAIEEGRRAVDLLPINTDALAGPLLVENLALVYAWTGERDLACKELTNLLAVPQSLSYGELLLHPEWDDLRGYPCFEGAITRLAPK